MGIQFNEACWQPLGWFEGEASACRDYQTISSRRQERYQIGMRTAYVYQAIRKARTSVSSIERREIKPGIKDRSQPPCASHTHRTLRTLSGS